MTTRTEQAVRLVLSGKSRTAAAREAGVDRAAVSRAIKKITKVTTCPCCGGVVKTIHAKPADDSRFPLFTHPAPVIASEQKPYAYEHSDGSIDKLFDSMAKKLFTSPPNTADIEQRTAEAVAKMAEDKDVERTDYCMHVYEEGEQYKSDLIADIKASKWRGYL